MPLKRNMTQNEIVDYLRNDLANSVLDDVWPCVQPSNPRGGYFAVPRLVLSYDDYLGALYHGYIGRRGRNRRIFADHNYAKTFLKEIFGVIDVNYKTYGDLLWEIYRNGTVHLYEPMKLENQGKIVTWLVHKYGRIADVPTQLGNVNLTHLVPYQYGPSEWWQPISIVCLFRDLLSAIGEYANRIISSQSSEAKFRHGRCSTNS